MRGRRRKAPRAPHRITALPHADTHPRVLDRIGVIAVQADDYWPVLAGRLTLADTAGLPVPALLADTAGHGPLPAEDPAAALWWRLVPHLGAVTGTDTAVTASRAHQVRPAWTVQLEHQLGAAVAEVITADRLWPVLIARVDTAAAVGVDPGRVVTAAAGMLAPALDTLRPRCRPGRPAPAT